MDKKRIITTVGTSLFTNYMKKEVRESSEFKTDYEGIDTQFDDLDKHSYHGNDKNNYSVNWDKIKEIIKNYWIKNENRTNASAEIKSILKIAEEEGDIEVYLLATDTVLSVLSCELICKWLNSFAGNLVKKDGKIINISCTFQHDETHIITGLQVTNKDKFVEEGFHNLTTSLKKLKNKETILNISGGYKALIPFLTLYGQLENLPLSYIYEDSNDLITTGNLPVNFDWEVAQVMTQYLSREGLNSLHEDVKKILIENKLIQTKSDGDFQVSAFGELLKNYVESKSEVNKGTLGLFLESKFYEYFTSNNEYVTCPEKPFYKLIINESTYDLFDIDELKQKYPTISKEEDYNDLKKNIKNIDKDLTAFEEIDFIFKLKNDSNESVICEVKALGELNKVTEQLKKDVKVFQKEYANKFPSEILILFYKLYFQCENITDLTEYQPVTNAISRIEKEMKKFYKDHSIPEIPIRIMGANVQLSSNSLKVNYKKLLREPLNPVWVHNKP